MGSRKKTVLIGGSLVVVLLGVGGGVAIADTSSGTAPSTPTAAPRSTGSASSGAAKAKRKHPGLLARVGHGEVTLNGPKHEVVDVQRGLVQAVGATAITVRSNDGFTATYTVGSASKVRKDRKAGTIAQVATGDRVEVIAVKSGSTDTMRHIADAGPATK